MSNYVQCRKYLLKILTYYFCNQNNVIKHLRWSNPRHNSICKLWNHISLSRDCRVTESLNKTCRQYTHKGNEDNNGRRRRMDISMFVCWHDNRTAWQCNNMGMCVLHYFIWAKNLSPRCYSLGQLGGVVISTVASQLLESGLKSSSWSGAFLCRICLFSLCLCG